MALQTAWQDVLLNRDKYAVPDVAIDTSWQLQLIQIKTVCSHHPQTHEGDSTSFAEAVYDH